MRKRSTYRPKPVMLNAHQRVLDRFEPFTQEQVLSLDRPLRASLAALTSGTGTPRDLQDLAAAMNTTLVRGRSIDPACAAIATTGILALGRAAHRFETTGQVGLDGPGITEIRDALDLHFEIIQLSDPGQMVSALREVMEVRA